jgi:uncharacterized protein YecE (DUF72 family)
VQLPPKVAFDAEVVCRFLTELSRRSSAAVACEPRNVSWFAREADDWLNALRVARVAADPAICSDAAVPAGYRGLAYWRLHGSPLKYRSSYADRVGGYAEQLELEVRAGRSAWCIFDNGAASAAAADALALARCSQLVSLNAAIAATMARISRTRNVLDGSWNHRMPTITVPTAPIPPQTA